MTDWDALLDDMTATVAGTFPKCITYTRLELGTVHDKTPSGTPLTAIYDVVEADTTEGPSRTVTNRRVVIDIRLADLGFDPMQRDLVTVHGIGDFTVLNRIPSSSGMMKLVLREA